MMKLSLIYIIIHNKTLHYLMGSMVFMSCCFSASAQEDPPRPLQVTTFQNLSFGAVIQGTVGGKVIIDPQGSRSITGDLIPVNMGYTYYPAIFEIRAIPGCLITIVNGPDIIMNGPGGTLTLHIGTSIPTSPFVNTRNPSSPIQVRIGGTLTVGNSMANPSGNYIGNFSVTFAQQ
jgi:hypothetical protein